MIRKKYKIEADAVVRFETEVYLTDEEFKAVKDDRDWIFSNIEPDEDMKEIISVAWVHPMRQLVHRYCAECGEYLGELDHGQKINLYCEKHQKPKIVTID